MPHRQKANRTTSVLSTDRNWAFQQTQQRVYDLEKLIILIILQDVFRASGLESLETSTHFQLVDPHHDWFLLFLFSQGYGFSTGHIWMWELDCEESWAPKNWCFWTVVLEKTLESPWSNQSILKEISPEYSLEGLMLKLKLQYFGHLMRRADSFEKTLMWGKMEGRTRRGRQRMR